MSPFGGSTTDPVWRLVDSRMFVLDDDCSTWEQAAFRVAGELPRVGQLAVGTNNADHLRSLVAAASLAPNGPMIAEYRALLRVRHTRLHERLAQRAQQRQQSVNLAFGR